MMKIAGVVLAGGKSSRMGENKSQLIINQQTLLEYTKKLLHLCDLHSVYVSGNDGIKDKQLDKGPVSGVLTCMSTLTDYDYILFIPVDMPLLTVEIINYLIHNKSKTISFLEKYNLPFITINSARIIQIIQKHISVHKLSLFELFQAVKAKSIEHNFNEKLFINTNSPEQWQEIIQLLQSPKQ